MTDDNKNPPKTNPYVELDEKGIDEQLSLFKDVIKDKKLDLYTKFGLKKPEEPTKEQLAEEEKNKQILTKFSEIQKILAPEGGSSQTKTEPTTAEKEALERIENMEKSKFAEQVTDVTSIDADFPVKVIQELDVPYKTKISIMSAMKQVAQGRKELEAKFKKELDDKAAGEQGTKFSGETQEKQTGGSVDKTPAGKAIVAKFSEKYGYKTPSKEKKE